MAYNNNNNGGFEKKTYQGNWKCAGCNADITELPFQPDPARINQLRCRDCYKKQRAERGNYR